MALRQAQLDAVTASAPEDAVLRAHGRLLGFYRGCRDCERLVFKALSEKLPRTRNLSVLNDALALMEDEPVGFVKNLGPARREEARALALSWAELLPFAEQREELLRLAGGLTPMEDKRERERLFQAAFDAMPATFQLYKLTPSGPDAQVASRIAWLERNPDRDPKELVELASTVVEPKLRASLLLAAAFRYSQHSNLARAKEIVCAVGASAGDDPDIRSAALFWELAWEPYHGAEERWRTMAETLIGEYPRFEMSCAICEQYVNNINPLTEPSARHFIDVCRTQLDLCPKRRWMWRRLVGRPGPDALAINELVLASNPDPELLPEALLSQSDLLAAADPQRAAQLENEALQLPGLRWCDVESLRLTGRARNAEARGDFERAIFWNVVAGQRLACGAGPWRDTCQEFWDAYYSLRAGIEPEKQWTRLLACVPEAVADSRTWTLDVERLDRLACAATLACREGELAERLRWLAIQHHETVQRGVSREQGDELRRKELILQGYAADLDSGRARCAS